MTTRERIGRIECTRHGYAFVRLEDEPGDLFIPPGYLGRAIHGDRVRVGFLETGRAGDAHEVWEVLERSRLGIVGRIESSGRRAILHPDRPEFPTELALVLTGRRGVSSGSRVLVRLKPRPVEPITGSIEAVFRDDDPREDSWLVALEEGLPTEFAPEAEAEASSFHEGTVARAATGRDDFRESLVLTIDPADAKDHDDAIGVVGTSPDGGVTLGIHIADVSHYVRPGSILDAEARNRGCSVYLADTTYPMLPNSLSSGLCSLSQGADRLTVSVLAEVASDGTLAGARVVEGVIRSAASLSYPEAAQAIREGSGEISAALRTLDGVARSLRSRRLEVGGLDIDLPEIRPGLDASGEPVAFAVQDRLPTHDLIEEFMLLANRIVGRRAQARELPFLYRVHERPRYDKLRAFAEAARYLGRQGPLAIVTDARQLRRWVSHGSSARDRILNLHLLRALEKARYDLADVGHFGLGMKGYAHFTSPIRRYPDLANHRVVKRYLLDGRRAPAADPWRFVAGWLDAAVARRATDAEVTADDAERAVARRKAARFARARLGEETRGIISGVMPAGLFVWLIDWNIEGFAPKRALGDPTLQLAEHGFSFRSKRSRHRLGLCDAVRVSIARADPDRSEVELALVARRGHASSRRSPVKGRRARPRAQR